MLCKIANASEVPRQGIRDDWKQLSGLMKPVKNKALYGGCLSALFFCIYFASAASCRRGCCLECGGVEFKENKASK